MSQASTVAPAQQSTPMSHREVLEALSGLLLAMFVAMLSSTVVSTALPRIVADLHGTESGYTWVMVSMMLALTATTPIWGKLADLFNKKLLVQVALLIYVAGSIVAGLSTSMPMLIGARVIQGLGVGGLTALVQVVIASIVSPRERGRYSGYLGAVFAVATVSGPLIGGLIVDTDFLGWRWCFGVGVPFAALAFVVLQKTLHLPTVRRDNVRIDYLGATLIAAGFSLLLAWVTLAGSSFAWASATTAVMVTAGVGALVAAVYVESRVAEPVIPLKLFRSSTVALSVFASVMVGVVMFGSTVFLAQYFQLSRGMSPTHAGLMSLPLVLALAASSVVSGRTISRTGHWKGFLVGGAMLIAAGTALLSLLDADTPLVVAGLYTSVVGAGMGLVMQNLVLAVQNTVRHSDIGAASSLVATFRTLGGAVGVALLGTALSHKVTDLTAPGLRAMGITPSSGHQDIPDLSAMPAQLRDLFTGAFGEATGHVFLLVVPFAILAALSVTFLRNVPLRTTLQREDELV
jgi:EmrB/QacA subfamily drug resistance transporter